MIARNYHQLYSYLEASEVDDLLAISHSDAFTYHDASKIVGHLFTMTKDMREGVTDEEKKKVATELRYLIRVYTGKQSSNVGAMNLITSLQELVRAFNFQGMDRILAEKVVDKFREHAGDWDSETLVRTYLKHVSDIVNAAKNYYGTSKS